MTDWYNDPPEEAEMPECCGREMIVDAAGECLCEVCGGKLEAEKDGFLPAPQEIWPPADEEPPAGPALCPHGEEWGECAPCDHASDLAFDAAREKGR